MNPTNYRCDFCGENDPQFMFTHPRVDCSKLLCKVFEPGYFAACQTCSDLIEAGKLEALVDRVMAISEKAKVAPFEVIRIIRAELLRLYGHVSQTRKDFPVAPK